VAHFPFVPLAESGYLIVEVLDLAFFLVLIFDRVNICDVNFPTPVTRRVNGNLFLYPLLVE